MSECIVFKPRGPESVRESKLLLVGELELELGTQSVDV